MSISYEKGRYRAVIASQTMSESSTKNTQFVLTFDLLGMYDPTEPDALRPVQHGQRSVFRAITEKTIDYFLEDLKYLGYDKPSFANLDPSHPQCHNFKGQEIDVICDHETYQDKLREKWSLSRGGGLNLKPADNTAVRKLDALFGSKLKQNAAPTTKRPEPQPAASGPGFEEQPL